VTRKLHDKVETSLNGWQKLSTGVNPIGPHHRSLWLLALAALGPGRATLAEFDLDYREDQWRPLLAANGRSLLFSQTPH
jgi:hypothetical protein